MFSWLGKFVAVFWLMKLDLVSLKGNGVSSSRFGLSMGSGCLWAVLLALAVLDTSNSTVASKWPSQHIITAASPLLDPGIFAVASVPWSHSALQAKAC